MPIPTVFCTDQRIRGYLRCLRDKCKGLERIDIECDHFVRVWTMISGGSAMGKNTTSTSEADEMVRRRTKVPRLKPGQNVRVWICDLQLEPLSSFGDDLQENKTGYNRFLFDFSFFFGFETGLKKKRFFASHTLEQSSKQGSDTETLFLTARNIWGMSAA